ncbi:hypothetical protein [Adhaeribacter radiodurans]|uniref:Uncharacterized protein n=1 Tax=Adhaeribacter radiodurans TaxID=2745197 RepID=A0A7L7L938_9BACT|nr:hypothetical protein [Adhaeribacter radiodurans]QMU29340.1 hypothetical protein HUW48_15435 [Adhaeribacter radiodurans]
MVQRFVVVVTDPADRNSVLLRSLEYEFENEAHEILNYILTHCAEISLYEKEGRREKWNYHLKRITQENDYEVIASQSFPTQKAAETAFDLTIKTLRDFFEAENFHLVEHILLRPKVSPRERSGKRSSALNSDAVDILTVIAVAKGEITVPLQPKSTTYTFRILNTKNECKTNWRLTLNKNDSEEIVIVNENFIFYRHLTHRMEQIQQFGSNRSNYLVEQNADGYYIFRLLDVDRTLAESKKRYRQQEEMEAELNSLITFFSHEQLPVSYDPEAENPLVAQADPYSFQISILIPDWPAKFRNKTFKHLLEKTIYMETPAHIYPQVYWLDHKQMREFEEAYKLWLEELPQAEISNTEVVNNLIYQLNELRK